MVQPGEGALDDPADGAEPGAVRGLTTGDLLSDATPAELTPVLVVVVAAVGGDPLRPAPWLPNLAAHRWYALDQRDEPR